MSSAGIWVAALLAAPLVYVLACIVGVAVLTAISAAAGRGSPKDAAQAQAFEGARAGTWRRVRGLFVEGVCQALAFAKQLLHAIGVLRRPPRRPGATPVVLLPGYTENSGTMHTLGTRLGAAGYDPILLDFPSTFAPVEHNARWLGEALRALCTELGIASIFVVGHSMGGLITRTLIHSEADHRVRALVAIASPFRGTFMARIGAFFRGGRSTHNMVPGSSYLTRFPAALPEPVPILSVVAIQDDIISPPWNSILPGAENVVLAEPYGHEAPLFVPSAFAIVERWLSERAAASTRDAQVGSSHLLEHVLHQVNQEQDRER